MWRDIIYIYIYIYTLIVILTVTITTMIYSSDTYLDRGGAADCGSRRSTHRCQERTSKGIWQQGIVLKHRKLLQKEPTPCRQMPLLAYFRRCGYKGRCGRNTASAAGGPSEAQQNINGRRIGEGNLSRSYATFVYYWRPQTPLGVSSLWMFALVRRFCPLSLFVVMCVALCLAMCCLNACCCKLLSLYAVGRLVVVTWGLV